MKKKEENDDFGIHYAKNVATIMWIQEISAELRPLVSSMEAFPERYLQSYGRSAAGTAGRSPMSVHSCRETLGGVELSTRSPI